jgi:hypothetical protein
MACGLIPLLAKRSAPTISTKTINANVAGCGGVIFKPDGLLDTIQVLSHVVQTTLKSAYQPLQNYTVLGVGWNNKVIRVAN